MNSSVFVVQKSPNATMGYLEPNSNRNIHHNSNSAEQEFLIHEDERKRMNELKESQFLLDNMELIYGEFKRAYATDGQVLFDPHKGAQELSFFNADGEETLVYPFSR